MSFIAVCYTNLSYLVKQVRWQLQTGANRHSTYLQFRLRIQLPQRKDIQQSIEFAVQQGYLAAN